jgi:TusA-related sulfurtransferase
MEVDLRGIPCPLSFVRTKLKLERLVPGEQLVVWLDAGEPIEQVPNSLQVAGHHVRHLQQHSDGHYILVVERGATDPLLRSTQPAGAEP